MKNLNRHRLRRLIQLEMKSMMDEDALLAPPSLGEPHYVDYHEDEYEDDHDCEPCKNKKLGIYEAESDCGCHSNNDYEEEREEYFDHDDHKHSSYMARPQLYKIAKYASKLLDMVDENEQLDDWQESKIAQISQMIGSVYHSLDYDEEYDDYDDLDMHDLLGMISTGNI